MSQTTLITAATAAATSKNSGFYVNPNETVTIMCSPDLAGAETVAVQISHDGGATWVAYQYGGSAVQLDATQNAIQLSGPMLYRVSKGVTVGTVGVYMTQGKNQNVA